MVKYTQKQLKSLVNERIAADITNADCDTRRLIEEKEGYYTQVGYSSGVYGCNGMLLRGKKTGQLYAICSRSQAIDIF